MTSSVNGSTSSEPKESKWNVIINLNDIWEKTVVPEHIKNKSIRVEKDSYGYHYNIRSSDISEVLDMFKNVVKMSPPPSKVFASIILTHIPNPGGGSGTSSPKSNYCPNCGFKLH